MPAAPQQAAARPAPPPAQSPLDELWPGPQITGFDHHFADPAVEAAFRATMVPAHRSRLIFVILVVMAIAAINIGMDALAPPELQGLGPSPRRAAFARVAVILVAAILLRRVRRAQTYPRLQHLAILAGVLWWTTRIASELVPDPQVYAGSGMIIGSTVLLYIGLPIEARLHIPGMIFFSLSTLAAAAWRGALPWSELVSTIVWLAGVHFPAAAAVLSLRSSLRRSYAQRLAFEQLALYDPLTGLANRRRFDAELAAAWTRASHAHDTLSLILIDLDHFKLFNDHAGTAGGDAALVQVADVLRAELGARQACIARTGGAEFACLLPDTSASAAANIAAGILAAVAAAGIAHPGSPCGPWLTASLGIATASRFHSGNPAGLYELAARLLHTAKSGGRARSAAGLLAG